MIPTNGLTIALADIDIMQGFNPRKYFDAAKHQELIDSVLMQGVIQPIVVRPQANGGGYWLVCGERRYRAAIAAGLSEIPAVVRDDLDDSQAKLLAIIENAQRDDMSPAEEAESARDILTECANDRDEAAKRLGWSKPKFEARMLLLHASANVLAALTERKIKLGHAELLSQLPHEYQDNTLAKILDQGFSVADLKAKLSLFALKLSDAVFDLGGCQGCPYNSAMQASLFDDHITSGQCANHDCFQGKTRAALSAKKAALSEQYAVVFLDTERSPGSFVMTCKSGKNGVGNLQFEQGCRQCAHFGALLNTSPDRLGEITEDCCFDIACHKTKVDEHQKSLLPPQSSQTGKDGKKAASGTDGKSATAKNNNSPNEKKAAATELPGKVNELIMTFYRSLAGQQAVRNEHIQHCLDCYTVYRLVHQSFDKTQYPSSLSITTASLEFPFDRFMTTLLPVSTNDIIRFKHDLYAHLIHQHEADIHLTRTWAKASSLMLAYLAVPLEQHFLLDKQFLSAFTKGGMASLLMEAVNGKGERFVTYYENARDGNNFSALMKKKNAEILQEVFSCGFDFTGFVPACVLTFMGEDKSCRRPEHADTTQSVATLERIDGEDQTDQLSAMGSENADSTTWQTPVDIGHAPVPLAESDLDGDTAGYQAYSDSTDDNSLSGFDDFLINDDKPNVNDSMHNFSAGEQRYDNYF